MLEAERAGKPAVVVCNQAYANVVRSTARVLGAPDHRFVSLPVLLANLTDEQVEAQAEEVIDAIVACLTQDG